MTNKQYFTVAQANAMIPFLERRFQRIFQITKQMDETLDRIDVHDSDATEQSMDTIEVNEDSEDENLFDDLVNLKLYSQALEDEIESLQNQGCLVKDLRQGLVDWYAINNNRDILLCWKYGEKHVNYWHELSSGYKGRRSVDEIANVHQHN